MAGPTPGLEKVIVKRAALVTMQKQMAALVRGEGHPSPSAQGQRGSEHALCGASAVGREDTKCPVCHLVFKTPYWLRKHMGVHRGGSNSPVTIAQSYWPATTCYEITGKAASRGPSSLVRSVVGSM